MADSKLLGVRIEARRLPNLISEVQSAMLARSKPFVFACANPHSLVVARSDPEFRRALDLASTVVADGVGCQWGAALSGVPLTPRITGFDFFRSVMTMLNDRAGKAFFFGSSQTVLEKLVARVNRDFPHVTVAALSPPFRPWSCVENAHMINDIRSFAPEVLWVGMTAPKQEKWVALNCDELNVPVVASIGAVFDYYAGVTRRAPQWICNLGLEWLYRLPREPKRLWKRTFVSAPLFLWLVLVDRVRR